MLVTSTASSRACATREALFATFHRTIVKRVVTRAILARELPDTAASVMLSEAFRSSEQVLMDVGSGWRPADEQ